ncbi:hypothetical protein DFJ73DRAFT_845976 [Zopfochytrium polystomum]|nr:hypothetical protein DFJ73DRAFT_845976 [Zopfochytrium polystomum]
MMDEDAVGTRGSIVSRNSTVPSTPKLLPSPTKGRFATFPAMSLAPSSPASAKRARPATNNSASAAAAPSPARRQAQAASPAPGHRTRATATAAGHQHKAAAAAAASPNAAAARWTVADESRGAERRGKGYIQLGRDDEHDDDEHDDDERSRRDARTLEAKNAAKRWEMIHETVPVGGSGWLAAMWRGMRQRFGWDS